MVIGQPPPFAEITFCVDKRTELWEDHVAKLDPLGPGPDEQPALIRRVVSFLGSRPPFSSARSAPPATMDRRLDRRQRYGLPAIIKTSETMLCAR